jgi:hypothetical protein
MGYNLCELTRNTKKQRIAKKKKKKKKERERERGFYKERMVMWKMSEMM